MSCGTTHFATCIRIRMKVAKWLFRNTFQGLQMCCGTTHSVTFIWICMEVAEWVVLQLI